MRRTITLDLDVERLLMEKVRRSKQSFKQVLNNAIRKGLKDERAGARHKGFRVNARALRLRVGSDAGRLSEVGDDLELQAFLDVSRRLSNRTARSRGHRPRLQG